jgi:hypothetical protein
MLAQGVQPDTEVVIGSESGDWVLIKEATSPKDNPDFELWVTLFAADEYADPRTTPAHYDSDPTPPHGLSRLSDQEYFRSIEQVFG